MSEPVFADILFTLRAIAVALACAWGVRGLRGTLKLRLNWHAWALILAGGVVAIAGYSCWMWWHR